MISRFVQRITIAARRRTRLVDDADATIGMAVS